MEKYGPPKDGKSRRSVSLIVGRWEAAGLMNMHRSRGRLFLLERRVSRRTTTFLQ